MGSMDCFVKEKATTTTSTTNATAIANLTETAMSQDSEFGLGEEGDVNTRVYICVYMNICIYI
jgi:hypothetical protein